MYKSHDNKNASNANNREVFKMLRTGWCGCTGKETFSGVLLNVLMTIGLLHLTYFYIVLISNLFHKPFF